MSRALRTLALSAALALSGCATFEREWKAGAAAKPDAFAGRWEGRWTSAKHGAPGGGPAGGKLRCILTKTDERNYRAHFKANWLIFASGYTVSFHTEQRGGALEIRGQHEIGGLGGGAYSYAGRITPAAFRATYDSSYDRGIFEMARPAQ